MKKTYDIIAIGECLIDFVPSPSQEEGKLSFTGCPGGAPANVLACASGLGLKTAFIGKIGNDVFGQLLQSTLKNSGIDTSSLIISKEYPTTLAFVSLDENGDRSFSFYRNQTADCMIKPNEVEESLFAMSKVFHFGSVSMTTEPSRGTTLYAVKMAKKRNMLISFDPNLREPLWESLVEAKEVILEALAYCDIVKLSEEEIEFLTGIKNIDNAMVKLFNQYNDMKLLVVTMGSKGSKATFGENILMAEGFNVKTIDTVGAGDAFWGAFLYQVLSKNFDLDNPNEESLRLALSFSNASGALSTTKKGAISTMPLADDILKLIQGTEF